MTAIIEKGDKPHQFNFAVGIKALKEAYNNSGKPVRIMGRTWERLKNRFRDKFPTDAEAIIKSVDYSKNTITWKKTSTVRLVFRPKT